MRPTPAQIEAAARALYYGNNPWMPLSEETANAMAKAALTAVLGEVEAATIERCAQVADSFCQSFTSKGPIGEAAEIAAAIRALTAAK
jgi:hypothetical protein